MQLLICTRTSESRIRSKVVPLLKKQVRCQTTQFSPDPSGFPDRKPRVKPFSTETQPRQVLPAPCADGSLSLPCKHHYTHVSLQGDSSYWKLQGIHLGHGKNILQLQVFGSLSICGVSGFISNRLIFQCYFRNREGKRETPAFNFRFHSHSGWAVNAWACPLLSKLLVRKVMPESVLRMGLGSSRRVKEVCSHSVVGAFCTAAGIHFRPCCVSRCLRKSTFRWKPLPHRSQPKGLKPVCFRLWVMRLELWLKAFPHTWHLWGFSPAHRRWEKDREKVWKKQHAAYTGP